MLVDGDDHNDPVADAIRGTLDGHIVLDRAIADQGRYPAVNVLASVSRLADHAWSAEERALVLKLRAMIARFEDTRDLRLMGGYQCGPGPGARQGDRLRAEDLSGHDPEPRMRQPGCLQGTRGGDAARLSLRALVPGSITGG